MAEKKKVSAAKVDLTVKHTLLSEWCGISPEVMRRVLSKFGLPSTSPIDLRDLVSAMVALLRANEKKILAVEGPDDELTKIAHQIEVETARQKLEQLRAKTGILKREWVRVSDVQERTAAMARAMRTAGEQLGHRFGPDAQEIFDSALTMGTAGLLSLQTLAESQQMTADVVEQLATGGAGALMPSDEVAIGGNSSDRSPLVADDGAELEFPPRLTKSGKPAKKRGRKPKSG